MSSITTRLKIALYILALLVTPTYAQTPSPSENANKPNVIVLFTDDQGYGDLGCYGATTFKTPNVDRMAERGTKFTDFYAAAAACTPSRAALLTGYYPQRIGLQGVLDDRAKIGLGSYEVTLANYLKQNGYATGMYGKWHLGSYPQFMPLQHGFDEFFGIPYSMDMWPFHPRPGPKGGYAYKALPLYENERIIEYNPNVDQMTTRITEHAVDFIQRHKDEPFFLYVPYPGPHVPLGASGKFKGKSEQGLYGDVIMEIDWSVGQIIGELEKDTKLLENTLVIFSSDNGPWLLYGNHGGSSGGLREGKGTTFGGGQKVPFIVQMPGTVPAGRVCKEIVTALDIMPTVLHATNTTQPGMRPVDGKNVWPIFIGEKGAKSPTEAFFFVSGNDIQAVRSGKWKLHVPHKYGVIAKSGNDGMPGKYAKAEIGLALFDLEKDPEETIDLAQKHPKIVMQLTTLITDFEEDLKNNSRKPGMVD